MADETGGGWTGGDLGPAEDGPYAVCRMRLLTSAQAVRRAGEHAARRDKSAAEAMRPDADPQRRAVGWVAGMDQPLWIKTTAPGEPIPLQCDYLRAYHELRQRTGAAHRKGSALTLHMMCIVSQDWLAETGDPYDFKNPRVRDLWTQAELYAIDIFGVLALIGRRMDTDERGAGVVDIFVSPVRPRKMGRAKTPGPTISPNHALEELAERRGKDPSSRQAGTLLNDSWVEWAQLYLSPELKRGQPYEETRRHNIAPAAYRRRMAELDEERERLEAEIARLRDQNAAAQARLAHQERRAAVLAAWVEEWTTFLTDPGVGALLQDLLPDGIAVPAMAPPDEEPDDTPTAPEGPS